ACCRQDRGADVLRAKHAQLSARLASNPYGRPLYIESHEYDNALKGEVYAVVNHSFAQVRDTLSRPASWCEVMLLPFNTKGCAADADSLHVYVGRKSDTPIDNAFRIDFRYGLKSLTEDYLHVALDAPTGPVGTHDYRIVLEAAPLEGGRTFLHLSYSYAFGAMSRIAMQTYLSTAGSGKVGFSEETDPQGRAHLVQGVRGVVERNTMRYFLAIGAFLDSLTAPPELRVEKRLRDWFEATERYRRQLHEMDMGEYLSMKLREYARLAAR
ncbi:MAG TPA: hypothetical protein VFP36_15555, partial [Usitatibacter sp.]|nr:hypothetical protein [Usitatibacter sp.]